MIENSIREQALKSTELTELIVKRFHFITKHKSADNYVLLRVISDDTPTELHLEDSQSEASIQFDCYSKPPVKAQLIAKAINNIFNKKGFEDASIKVQIAKHPNRIPDQEPDSGLYRESLDYTFYYHNISYEV